MRIEKVLSENGITLNKDGKYLVGISPFSDSKLPLLVVDVENQTFADLSTGINGDIIDLLINLYGVSKKTAEEMVNKRNISPNPEEKILKDICRDTAEYYKSRMNKVAGEYLRNRGFDDEDIKNIGFGYADRYGANLYKELIRKYKKEDILKSGVCKLDKEGKVTDLFWKRIIIPIKNSSGEIVAFGGRVLDDGTPKYINSPESPIFKKRELLYGYDIAKDIQCKAYIICEGYMDVLSLHKAGLTNAVASLGTALSMTQCELLKNKKRVYVLYDTDQAGRRASEKAIPMLEKAGLNTKVIDYRPAKDPDEFIKTYGLDRLKERFREAEEGERYLVKNMIEEDVKKAVNYLSSMNVRKIIDIVN